MVDKSYMFQSTRPRGARLSVNSLSFLICLFQSTRPRGARQHSVSRKSLQNSFNPRAHAGRDKTDKPPHAVNHVSIHAPTRGATAVATSRQVLSTFQSTRPRGARQFKDFIGGQLYLVSIHAPTRGATI